MNRNMTVISCYSIDPSKLTADSNLLSSLTQVSSACCCLADPTFHAREMSLNKYL